MTITPLNTVEPPATVLNETTGKEVSEKTTTFEEVATTTTPATCDEKKSDDVSPTLASKTDSKDAFDDVDAATIDLKETDKKEDAAPTEESDQKRPGENLEGEPAAKKASPEKKTEIVFEDAGNDKTVDTVEPSIVVEDAEKDKADGIVESPTPGEAKVAEEAPPAEKSVIAEESSVPAPDSDKAAAPEAEKATEDN